MPETASPSSRRILAIWLTALAIDRWQMAEGTSSLPPSSLEEGLGVVAPQVRGARHHPAATRPGCAGPSLAAPPLKRRGEGAAPFALLNESAHGPRIAAINAAARTAGVQPDAMLTDARALCPDLAVHPGDPAGDRAFLEKLALWAQRWGPWSALDPPDGLLVDVTGVAHLFGGERGLLDDAAARFAMRGLAVRLAIAPTAGAAWALAHYGPERAVLHPGDSLADLSVAALRLDPATLLVLRRLGLKRVGELSGVARDALSRRFRSTRAPAANPLIRLDQLLGKVPEPLLPVLAQEMPLVQRRLMEPIRHRSLLDQVLGDLTEDMIRLLEGQAKGARRLDLTLWKVDGEVAVPPARARRPQPRSGAYHAVVRGQAR